MMAKFSATDVKVTINGTNVSTYLAEVDLKLESDEQETTAFGTAWRSKIGGLSTASLTLSWLQDFASGGPHSVITPLWNTLATVVVAPTSASLSATNPAGSGLFLVNDYGFSASVGDVATIDTTWPSSGTVAWATS
jgi:hypothetical protein